MSQDAVGAFAVVTEWQIRHVPAYDAFMIRFAFLSHEGQALEDAEPGRNYVFHPDQLRELKAAIDDALERTAGDAVPRAMGRR